MERKRHFYLKPEAVEKSKKHNEERKIGEFDTRLNESNSDGCEEALIKLLTSLCKWTAGYRLGGRVRRQELLRATNGRKLWRPIIA